MESPLTAHECNQGWEPLQPDPPLMTGAILEGIIEEKGKQTAREIREAIYNPEVNFIEFIEEIINE